MTLPKLARKSIEYFFNHHEIIDLQDLQGIPTEFLTQKAGAFVSLHRKNGALRGCIGTFLPTQNSIAEEVIHNALSAAFNDPRFWPLAKEELPDINISVDILSAPEPVKDINNLDFKKFGVIVSAPDGRKGLLLPDLEGIETVEEQLAIARQKAGILPDEPIKIERFSVQRFHE